MEKVLFVCGLIPEDYEIKENTINFMNEAANAFQKKFIEGFKSNNVQPIVLSAPFIGPFPMGYKKMVFNSKKYDDEVNYVSFFNVWGMRNFSRYFHLRKEIRNLNLLEIDNVVIYSVHTPFAGIAKYVKKRNPNSKICLIVPDLPEYSNLQKNQSFLYKIAKIFDCKSFYRKLKYFDCFSLVSKFQAEKINLYSKEQVVIESFAKDIVENYTPTNNDIKKIVYTGALNEQFGVRKLLTAFLKSDINAQLVFCGTGDSVDFILKATHQDSRIVYRGVVTHDESIDIQRQADVLINPRLNEGEYTKYSFPSKTIEYLSTGRPVICYKLDGIPDEYDKHLIYPKNTTFQALVETVEDVLGYDEEKCKEIFYENTQFLFKEKNVTDSTKKLLDMLQ